MTVDAAPSPEATRQKVSRAGMRRETGSCLKPMVTRYDVLLQAGSSLCEGRGICLACKAACALTGTGGSCCRFWQTQPALSRLTSPFPDPPPVYK